MEKVEEPYAITPEIERVYQYLLQNSSVKQALAFIESDNDATMRDQIRITEVPAPSFQEHTRGKFYQGLLEACGLQDVQFDAEGNVFGVRRGTDDGPTLFVCAHLDTVFPEGTNTLVQEREGVYYAPGIADDGRGLASTLAILRALNAAHIQTKGDIIFGATVGEEGMGDLRGVKAFFQGEHDVDGFISIEPGDPARTTYLATGSHRYRISYKGPGGHSFGDFGTPSAIHALGRAIAKISEVQVPSEPKTTFTVGEICGGTSVNTIAQSASMLVDMRSNSDEALLNLEEQILSIVRAVVEEENQRWNTTGIEVEIELVGNRPAGAQDKDCHIVQTALAATKAIGFEPELDGPSSTDSNVPIALGIPAVTLGGGGAFGGTHTLQECFNPTDAFYGIQKIFLTTIGLVGVTGVSEPLLEKR